MRKEAKFFGLVMFLQSHSFQVVPIRSVIKVIPLFSLGNFIAPVRPFREMFHFDRLCEYFVNHNAKISSVLQQKAKETHPPKVAKSISSDIKRLLTVGEQRDLIMQSVEKLNISEDSFFQRTPTQEEAPSLESEEESENFLSDWLDRNYVNHEDDEDEQEDQEFEERELEGQERNLEEEEEEENEDYDED